MAPVGQMTKPVTLLLSKSWVADRAGLTDRQQVPARPCERPRTGRPEGNPCAQQSKKEPLSHDERGCCAC